MPNWVLILTNLVFDLTLVLVLVTGRLGNKRLFGIGPNWVDRRENPYFYWFFTALLAVICIILGLRLAEASMPGFHAPAFLG